VPDLPGSYQLGDPVREAIRCPKGCGLLLVNGRSCGCTWQAEPDADPLVGHAVLITDKDGRRVLSYGTIAAVERTEDGMELTVEHRPL
jgi:hypothetical protein